MQPIYLLKSNGLCCMTKIDEVLTFNITNGNDKNNLQSMLLWQRRGAISIIFLEAQIDKFLSKLSFYSKGEIKAVSKRNIH